MFQTSVEPSRRVSDHEIRELLSVVVVVVGGGFGVVVVVTARRLLLLEGRRRGACCGDRYRWRLRYARGEGLTLRRGCRT